MTESRIIPLTVLSVVAVATFTIAGPIASLFNDTPKEIQWQTDLNEAHQQSVLENRPMLLVFDADWCRYCDKMEKATFMDSSVVTYVNEKFVPVHLDLAGNMKIAEILEVERIPCTIALSPRADLLGRVVGYVNTVQYRETLVQVRALQTRVEQKLASEADQASDR
ncbi:MAG: thioredoxin family protein [Planctomycetaceae bacterium]|jgi:thioredoxin-like negative regulator of GroEL|nr:thioredoxin family protein [Planctomycetaceae bacterium]